MLRAVRLSDLARANRTDVSPIMWRGVPLLTSIVGTGRDSLPRACQQGIGGVQQLLDSRAAQAVGDIAPGSLGLDQTAVAQAGEVLGDIGLRQAGGDDDLAHGARPRAQGEQAGEAGGIG